MGGNKKLVPESDKYIELIPPVGINRHRVSLTHEHITMIYFATSATDKVIPEFDDDRSDEWKWCTKEDLKKIWTFTEYKILCRACVGHTGRTDVN